MRLKTFNEHKSDMSGRDFLLDFTEESFREFIDNVFEFYEYGSEIMGSGPRSIFTKSLNRLVIKHPMWFRGMKRLPKEDFYEYGWQFIQDLSEPSNDETDVNRFGKRLMEMKRFVELGKHTRESELQDTIYDEWIDDAPFLMELKRINKKYLLHDGEYYPGYEIDLTYHSSKHSGKEIEEYIYSKKDRFESYGFKYDDIAYFKSRTDMYEAIYITDLEDG